MSEFYDEMRGIANELLGSELGQTGIVYVHMTPGAGPADNPGPATPTEYTVKGAASGVQFKYVDGTTILSTDFQVVMAGRSDVTPNAKGFVKVNGVQYKIVSIIPKPAADNPVAWVIVVRK